MPYVRYRSVTLELEGPLATLKWERWQDSDGSTRHRLRVRAYVRSAEDELTIRRQLSEPNGELVYVSGTTELLHSPKPGSKVDAQNGPQTVVHALRPAADEKGGLLVDFEAHTTLAHVDGIYDMVEALVKAMAEQPGTSDQRCPASNGKCGCYLRSGHQGQHFNAGADVRWGDEVGGGTGGGAGGSKLPTPPTPPTPSARPPRGGYF